MFHTPKNRFHLEVLVSVFHGQEVVRIDKGEEGVKRSGSRRALFAVHVG